MKSENSKNPDCILREALDAWEATAFEIAVADLPEGASYEDLAPGLIDFFKDKYNATNFKTFY